MNTRIKEVVPVISEHAGMLPHCICLGIFGKDGNNKQSEAEEK